MNQTVHESGDWSLVWTGNELEARKPIPYDGVLTYSTEERGYVSSRKNSEYNLSEREVVKWYVRITQPGVSADELLSEVRAAKEVRP